MRRTGWRLSVQVLALGLAGYVRLFAADTLPVYCGAAGTQRYEGRPIAAPFSFEEHDPQRVHPGEHDY